MEGINHQTDTQKMLYVIDCHFSKLSPGISTLYASNVFLLQIIVCMMLLIMKNISICKQSTK
jgi:hypothetical protein